MADLYVRGSIQIVLKLIRATDHRGTIAQTCLGRGNSEDEAHAFKFAVCPGENYPLSRVKYVYQLLNHSQFSRCRLPTRRGKR